MTDAAAFRDATVLGACLDLLADAVTVLVRRRQRTVLALLGVAVGTAAVVAPVNIGHMARMDLVRQFQGMGIDILIASPAVEQQPNDAVGRPVPAEAFLGVRDAVPAIGIVAPLAQGSGMAVFRGQTFLASVTGATPHLAPLAGLKMAAGRFLSPLDEGAAVAVLGHDAAAELTGSGRALAVGDLVRVDDAMVQVVGLLAETPRNTLLPTDFGRSVIVPLGSVKRIRPSASIDAVLMKMADGTDERVTGRAAQAFFASLGRGGEMRVDSARQLIDSMRSQMKTVAGMIAALGGVALVVGGVGVMNVMLMSVLERRQEVGLRMAVGATRRDITLMFLAEAVVLSGLGALCGLGIGLAACGLYAVVAGMTLAVSVAVLPLALAVALMVGVAAGLYPALAASRLDPVVALRAGG